MSRRFVSSRTRSFIGGHLYHFNLATLEMMGRRGGYTVVSSSVSSDGGNITVIFQKADATPSMPEGGIPGNYERVSSILRRHTAFRHLFTLYPYTRPFRKLASRVEEQRSVRAGRSPQEVLNALISDALQPNKRYA